MDKPIKVQLTFKALLVLGIVDAGGDKETAPEKAEIILQKIREHAFQSATPGALPAIVFLSADHSGTFTEVEDFRATVVLKTEYQTLHTVVNQSSPVIRPNPRNRLR